MRLNKNGKRLLFLLAGLIVIGVITALPPVWRRVSFYASQAYADVKYAINPPSEIVFVPGEGDPGFVATSVAATLTAAIPTPAPSATPTHVTPVATPTATLTPTPLPASIYLGGVIGEPQLFNNCGPATLSMALSYYDWGQSQVQAAEVLKPLQDDKNVMPYEMMDFVNNYTYWRALYRMGGDLQTLKVLLNAGFPVIVEKGFEPANLKKEGWMGHYNLVLGYDDSTQIFTTMDSYLLIHPPGGGEISDVKSFPGFSVTYEDMLKNWRAFNNVFIVIYPQEKLNDVLNALGPLANDQDANRIAYERAMHEASTLSDPRDRFFAWFNVGTSLVNLQDYATAASAYDTAFGIYPQIEEVYRPYRALWYQTGPYFAYYYSGRYQDVIELATQTLDAMSKPILEESYYWRGMAYLALEDSESAVADFRESLKYHQEFGPSLSMLQQLGEAP
jgi:tetratricopeptide (TPR) repeat protein